MFWLWVVIGVLVCVVICLIIKIILMRKTAKEIEEGLAERLADETNTLIDISSRDKAMRNLAISLNDELKKLREERHLFQQGDAELKTAVTNISHDLRTPLTAICGYLDLLENEEKSGEAERYTGIIRDRTEMLNKLTEELFRYSVITVRQDDEEKDDVVINNVLEESIAAFYTEFKDRGITPVISICDKNVIRRVNRSSLSRIFANILNNAVKYSDGDLEISLSENGKITFANSAKSLNGVEVGKLFDRFYTVENARQSTGLGLTIARTLTEKMGGNISAGYENNRLQIDIVFPG